MDPGDFPKRQAAQIGGALNRGNWRNRYGTNTYDFSGELVALGDLSTLTPAQRKRVSKKENRDRSAAAEFAPIKQRRPVRGLNLIRLLKRERRRADTGLTRQRRKHQRERARIG